MDKEWFVRCVVVMITLWEITLVSMPKSLPMVSIRMGHHSFMYYMIYDLTLRMENLQLNPDVEENSGESCKIGHVKSFDLSTFNALDDNKHNTFDDRNEHEGSHIFDMTESTSANHHIAPYLSSPQDFQKGTLISRQVN